LQIDARARGIREFADSSNDAVASNDRAKFQSLSHAFLIRQKFNLAHDDRLIFLQRQHTRMLSGNTQSASISIKITRRNAIDNEEDAEIAAETSADPYPHVAIAQLYNLTRIDSGRTANAAGFRLLAIVYACAVTSVCR